MAVAYISGGATASAKPRLYPICFYNNNRPELVEFNSYYAPSLIAAFRAIAYMSVKAQIVPSPDGRWLIADTSNVQNTRIARLWPRLACIGNAGNTDRIRAEKVCVDYVKELLSTDNYVRFQEVTMAGVKVMSEHVLDGYLLYCRTISTRSDQ